MSILIGRGARGFSALWYSGRKDTRLYTRDYHKRRMCCRISYDEKIGTRMVLSSFGVENGVENGVDSDWVRDAAGGRWVCFEGSAAETNICGMTRSKEERCA